MFTLYSTHTVQAFVYIVEHTHCSSICRVHTLFKHLFTLYSTHTVQAFVYIVEYTHRSSICLHCTVHTLFKHFFTLYSTHTVQAFVYIVQYTHCSSICLHFTVHTLFKHLFTYCTVHTLFKHLFTLYSTHTVQFKHLFTLYSTHTVQALILFTLYYLLTGSSGWKSLAPFTSPHVLLFWTLAGNSQSLEKWSTYLLLPPLKFTLKCKLFMISEHFHCYVVHPSNSQTQLFLLDLFVHIYHITLEYYQAHLVLSV